MSDDYRPREHDHLVEPMFGGLGVKGEARAKDAEPPSRWRRLWTRLLAVFRLRR